MKVLVTNIYSDRVRVFEGDEQQIENELLNMFPHLRVQGHAHDLHGLLEAIESMQAYAVDVEGESLEKAETAGNLYDIGVDPDSEIVADMLGFQPQTSKIFEAAKFLSGNRTLSLDEMRRALYENGDVECAALQAYGLEVSESNLKALEAVQTLSSLHKNASEALTANEVDAALPDGDNAAEAITRAFKDHFVMPIKMGGKHTAGSLLARDEEGQKVFLLKTGSGGQSPAAGAREEGASPARREAAFWQVAENWGLGDYIPRADAILIDGKEYAAIELLPWNYRNADKVNKSHPGMMPRLLLKYLQDGLLHQWAVLDYVLGNPDRHAQNMMVSPEGHLVLIDHGSAFAGEHFDPAYDKYSFVPYYLRAWGPQRGFHSLPVRDKLHYMPRVNHEVEERLRMWLNGIHVQELEQTLTRYGINPQPSIERLQKLKNEVVGTPLDLAINRFWTGNEGKAL